MKTVIILSALLVTCSLVVLIGGFVTADRSKFDNDFIRIFPPHAADINSSLRIRERQFSLAGLSATHVYLKDGLGILAINLDLDDTIRIDLEIETGNQLHVDSPDFYLHNGSMASLQRGHVSDWKVDTTFRQIPGFTAIEFLTQNSAIFRSINIANRQNILLKPGGSQQYILPKQVDGLLCTDGYLQYSKEFKQLVYTYRYRNQFICLDTNLNVVRTGKTIDTTSVAKISVAEQDGKITMSKPPLVVNKGTCVDGKYLFVRSNLMARNESAEDFKDRSVIDVYNILDGSYRFSFYIDNYDGSKLRDFMVRDSVLVAVFKENVVRYDIPSKYLP